MVGLKKKHDLVKTEEDESKKAKKIKKKVRRKIKKVRLPNRWLRGVLSLRFWFWLSLLQLLPLLSCSL